MRMWSVEEPHGYIVRRYMQRFNPLTYQPVGPWGALGPMDFAYENIGISHLCAKTHVFLHTFGDPPETFKNQYKSTLGAFPLK